ncbi:acetylglutamate kinase [Candidatus Desantisbacteria bacterium CG2_30_40_21]|uniref:Acetylglutamate kinase n=5 Tax=unclassified Candidatus Desantisiibacteriota TaxID=3106372 RepID=A0A2M7JAR8_9BACT|nr:MAG: acetylglutamate kinase [Candidatus Desantisbacteria bacterium CG2_30_40_21]PIP41516.1 MAG: acetylglutamate kinase [Candidatus Desantisbacteria bacterium CG23_combo_of_CG06-09_8_20_14_all_40_23]PIX16510.1 MAG: acetylglutamate kinase [Candidatus Desantisbacteria bacterium CG_4_8_14_3_um_filter_40_12]PIY20066.1 MAG: acetylglutamate kinase [Candidatus Desantisbacteria bacterium CG_4_10_14_3_um_filter_40_18]PJB28858.1 MAG: acetylglutamate kinase [Candidatus Desantisbacteria bacterium CG_4_9_
MKDLILRVNTLIEALPYIKEFYGKTLVIKYGGAAMTDESLKHSFAQDIVLLKFVGMRPIVVHGGGPEITNIMEKMGKSSEFIDGKRVTDEETMEIVEMVLSGKINKEIVALINHHGGNAVGLSGTDGTMIEARKLHESLGLVGEVQAINPQIINTLDEAGFIPVIAPVGIGENSKKYNINADTSAAAIAVALNAYKFIFLTDTPGILRDANNMDSLIPTIRVNEIDDLIKTGVVNGGMIPKIEAIKEAAISGVDKAHIIDGRLPHALLLELLTNAGIGTEVVR